MKIKNFINPSIFIPVVNIGIVIFIILGFLFDSKGFLSNFFAELTGVLIGSLFTLIIVDEHYKFQEERKSKPIKSLIYKELYIFLSDLVDFINYYIIPSDERIKDYTKIIDNDRYFDRESFNRILKEIPVPLNNIISGQYAITRFALEQEGLLDEIEDLCTESYNPLHDRELYNGFYRFGTSQKKRTKKFKKILLPRIMLLIQDKRVLDLIINLEKKLITIEKKLPCNPYRESDTPEHINLIECSLVEMTVELTEIIEDIYKLIDSYLEI